MATGALRVYFDGAGGPQQLGQTGSSVVRPRVRAREMRGRARVGAQVQPRDRMRCKLFGARLARVYFTVFTCGPPWAWQWPFLCRSLKYSFTD